MLYVYINYGFGRYVILTTVVMQTEVLWTKMPYDWQIGGEISWGCAPSSSGSSSLRSDTILQHVGEHLQIDKV